MKRWVRFFALSLFLFVPGGTHAQEVVPSDDVVSHLNVRAEATTDSPVVGELAPGERAAYLGAVPYWYRVRLPDGTEGFVSKRWSELVTAPAEVAFQIHFLDVGTGDSAIVDVGENEIVIDGGMDRDVLHDYAASHDIIDGPVELVVLTHGDKDHWYGLSRFLGFTDDATEPREIREFWEPGYDRSCRPSVQYDGFLDDLQNLVQSSGATLLRPLEETHVPASTSGVLDTLRLFPGVSALLIHSDKNPPSRGGCSYQINNASIVLKLDLGGTTFLFTGDANGKGRTEPGTVDPDHTERILLDLESQFPGLLASDVLKVPHHGSETANTEAFINAVNPAFVIFSASTAHHLPKETVVNRYSNGQRVILRTDTDREKDLDHILCFEAQEDLQCGYLDVLSEFVNHD